MTNKYISLILCCSLTLVFTVNAYAAVMPHLDVYCPNDDRVCGAVHEDLVDPRKPHHDATSMAGQTVENSEQVSETIESEFLLAEKRSKMEKLSTTGPDVSRDLENFGVPVVEDSEKGTDTSVDVYKGKAKDVPTKVVDFKQEDEVEKVVMDAVIVANPITASERKAAEERKAAYIQQSTLDIVARVLYYKNELNKLRDTLHEMHEVSGEGDTVGVHEISIQMKDANQRIQALQEKILASRLELQGIKNLKNAQPVEQKININK